MRAQPSVTYDSLAAEYAQGGASARQAVLQLAALRQAQVTAMIGEEARNLSSSRQRAAVMLHTDTAYAQLLTGDTGSGLFQIGAARRVFAAMKENGRGDGGRTQAFERRWFAFVAGLLTANSVLDRADFFLRDGLALYPHDARLYVARGALQEERVARLPSDSRTGAPGSRDRDLEKAAADYRRAIEEDPTLAAAYLRLGWVHVTVHDPRARANIERALAVASDPVDRYLAYLMRGGIAERERRYEDAVHDYETARTIGPACQTPYIALARVETALGHEARAREIGSAFAALTEKAGDPWWDFHLGAFDTPSLVWLRSEAMTP